MTAELGPVPKVGWTVGRCVCHGRKTDIAPGAVYEGRTLALCIVTFERIARRLHQAQLRASLATCTNSLMT
ncbi:hypothetical protein ABTX81_17365 [Kitasatospora sp. NPDC097605]|uniref:hypothetical protein n=1 Tax=Kitasatospora sp. NPDC097605 TaxID=3157226 RepID=UPI0033221722